MNMLCPIKQVSLHSPQAIAIQTEALALSYQELDYHVSSLTSFLRTQKVGEGSRVAFVAITSVDTIALFFALFRLKAVACPLSYRLPPKKLGEQIARLNPQLVIEPDKIPLSLELSREEAHIDSSALATLLFTSGSSGIEKIAGHSLENHLSNARAVIARLNLEKSDIWHLALPLFHVGGLATLFRCFLTGCSVSLTPQDATILSLVPTQLYRLCKEKSTPPLKGAILGGAPLSETLWKTAKEQGFKLFTTYGMTEMSSQITLDLAPEATSFGLTSGELLPERLLKINEDKKIWVKGAPLFLGYWNEGRLSLPLKEDGWFATGDLGRWTEKQKLCILGRKDNMFISGGENILPEEIERVLLSLPEILEARVLPQSDPEFGARPVAYIATESGTFSEESLRERMRELLPGIKLPVRILPLSSSESLPKSWH